VDVRGRRLRKRTDEIIAFTSSIAFDGPIADHVIRTNMAHMVSLMKGGEVDPSIGSKCLRFLSKAKTSIGEDTAAEDFHQMLEQEAVDALGVEVAGQLNLGKSRNDQVATAIRMELRNRILSLERALCGLQDSFLDVAKRYGETIIPGYTHLQRAQPVTIAHHFFAYFDSIQRDFERLLQLYRRVNSCPMGSAALGGTNVKVDRRLTAELLGFDRITSNATDAVASRDLVVEALFCATQVMIDLSRIAEEQVLWSSKEFGFIEIADEYAASSSIMPQKKNPVVAEMARAKCGSVIGSLVAVVTILKSLPYSYNLDLQETTPHLWRAMEDAVSSVRILGGELSTMKFNIETLRQSTEGDFSTATALANYLVKEKGISFREAHAVVGELVRMASENGTTLQEVTAESLPSVSSRLARRVSIDKKTAELILDPANYLRGVVTPGGSNPKFIPGELARRRTMLAAGKAALSPLEAKLESSVRKLQSAVNSVTTGVKR